ncbi:protein kinase domain-containing protein [Sorangium sp. So ce388]|uniref:serine/threonine-protein kinase n=1 Tax=Sorangium sp. So ce388 TaxID=3133309 RepID=UPI003F5B8E08
MDFENVKHVQRAQARVGTVLNGAWRLDALIGLGGMAAVYAATHHAGARVAIKLLHPERARDKVDRARFLREKAIADTVDHPGIASVLADDVTEDGSPFLVMDLLDGETLLQRWKAQKGPLPPAEVLALSDQILDVLAAAHEKGVVHRDLKPDNIFLTRDGGVKLLDFGIARLRLPSGQTSLAGLRAMGTPAYMPPEQARARWDLVDARTDIWALGATMFSLLTNRYVQDAPTVNELFFLRMTCPIPSLARVEPSMHPAVVRVVDRALEFAQADRWPDARSMQAAVREALALVALAPPPRSTVAPPPRSTVAPPPRSTLAPPPPPRSTLAPPPRSTLAPPPPPRSTVAPSRNLRDLGALGGAGAAWSSPDAALPDAGPVIIGVALHDPARDLDDPPRAVTRAPAGDGLRWP